MAAERARAPGARIRVSAPAKINLGLAILGTRSDGYHLLESVFVPLDLADSLLLEVAPRRGPCSVQLVLAPDDEQVAGRLGALGRVPTDESNLAVRAARAFCAAAKLEADVSLQLTKRIPAGAGLGGGSSDAGAVLRALARLYPDALPPARLAALALSLGADVPFFLHPRPALVAGIGERIQPLEAIPRLVVVLANPGETVATAQVYEIYDVLAAALTPSVAGSTMRALSELLAVEPDDEQALSHCLDALLRNDLEAAAIRLCPPVGRLRRRLLEAGALAVGMSGSGATVYGVFSSPARAQTARESLVVGERCWAKLAIAGGGPDGAEWIESEGEPQSA